MKRLIDKIDFILELHIEVVFVLEKDLARAICRILGKEKPDNKLFWNNKAGISFGLILYSPNNSQMFSIVSQTEYGQKPAQRPHVN